MKKIVAAALALAVSFTLFIPSSLADEDGQERVTMGADLTVDTQGYETLLTNLADELAGCLQALK